jgi:hypothetical protein
MDMPGRLLPLVDPSLARDRRAGDGPVALP